MLDFGLWILDEGLSGAARLSPIQHSKFKIQNRPSKSKIVFFSLLPEHGRDFCYNDRNEAMLNFNFGFQRR
jgi:hypothetical protein